MQNETLIAPGAGAAVLADQYTREIGDYCKKALPVTINNDEYLSRVSALIVALNRMLAEYLVVSAHVHDCDMNEMLGLTATQLIRNVNRARAVLAGEDATRQ